MKGIQFPFSELFVLFHPSRDFVQLAKLHLAMPLSSLPVDGNEPTLFQNFNESEIA
jgi:hypothetical protein